MRKRTFVLSMLLCCCAFVWAQKVSVQGTVVDQAGEPLPAATVLLLKTDSTQATGQQTKLDGTFSLSSVKAGEYILKVSFVGYKTVCQNLTLEKGNKKFDAGQVTLYDNAKLMKEAEVTARVAQVEMHEDTFVYNSAAFRVTEGSNLEALIKKMPGMEVSDDGTVKVNGKTVKKIMVDGKEFFGEDTKMSMKNLPAKMVDKVKAYDKQSDYSRMTGIDDGEEETVLDLTVKKGMKEGWLVNVDASYGTEDRFSEKLNVSRFTDHSQYALMGSWNNVNDRGFGGPGGFGGGSGDVESAMAGGTFAWENGKKEQEKGYFEIGGNVRWNQMKNYSVNKSNSETFLSTTASQFVNSLSEGRSKNWNINSDFRLEWCPDTATNILFRPRFTYSNNENSNESKSVTFNDSPYEAGMSDPLNEYLDSLGGNLKYKDILVNDNGRQSKGDGSSYDVSGNLQVNRRLGKAGRNITLNLGGGINESKSDSYSRSLVRYFQPSAPREYEFTNQYSKNPSKSWNYSARLSYTEPIFKGANLQFSYQFQRRFSDSDRSLYSIDSLLYNPTLRNQYFGGMSDAQIIETLTLGYTPADSVMPSLLNWVNSQYATYNEYNHDVNVMFRYTFGAFQLNAGVSFQPQTTYMDYTKFSLDTTVVRNVFNWAPRVNFRWKISNTSQLRFRYNGRMNQPSMTNLLPITDTSDPMNITMGNPSLKPSWTNSANIFYNAYITEKQMGWMANVRWSQTQNAITNKTAVDVETGKRVTRPENIDGNWNASADLMFNSALDAQKYFNVMNRMNLGYTNSVGYLQVDQESQLSTTRSTVVGDNLRFNFRNDFLEVGVNGGFTYSHDRNEIRPSSNMDTWNYSYGGNIQYTAPWGTVFATDIAEQCRRGYTSESMNTNELVWNAKITHSFLKKKNLILTAEWFDILRNRSNISRTVSAVERRDVWTNAVNSYLLFHVIYELNLLGDKEARREGWGGQGMGPGGMPPGDGPRGGGGGGGMRGPGGGRF